MQRSKLVDNLHFLVDKVYKDNIDMSDFTVTMEYILPVSKEYKTETLTRSEELYKESKLEYKLPFDTKLTKEAGDIEVKLTFTKVDLDADGNGIQYVRETSPCIVTIVPVAAWSNIILDARLSAVETLVGEGGSVDEKIATAKQEAIDAAASDATTKANTAETNAKTHATELNTAMDTRVSALETKVGDGFEAISEASIRALFVQSN